MHEELTQKVKGKFQERIKEKRAEGVALTEDKLDMMLGELCQKYGDELSQSDEDRVDIICPGAPQLGDFRDIPDFAKKGKIVERMIKMEGTVKQLVINSQVEGREEVYSELFEIDPSGRDRQMIEEDPALAQARRTQQGWIDASNMDRKGEDRAFNEEDADRYLHEHLFDGKEEPAVKDENYKKDMEMALFKDFHDNAFPGDEEEITGEKERVLGFPEGKTWKKPTSTDK